MKYIKQSDTLHSLDNKIKIFSSLPNYSCVADNEIFLVKNNGIYKRSQNTLLPLFKQGDVNYVGEIKAFFGSTIPNGWLLCDGSQFDTSQYSTLYNFLGTNTVPDFRECVPWGTTTSIGVYDDDRIQCHTHCASGGHYHEGSTSGSHCHTICSNVVSVGLGSGSCSNWQMSSGIETTFVNFNISICPSYENVMIGQPTNTIYGASSSVTRDVSMGVNFIIFTGE